MIIFRQLDDGYQTAGIYWHVEYFDTGPGIPCSFPVGTAYVLAIDGHAQLNFILVADLWRKKCIADALVTACKARWPNLQVTSATGAEGFGLIKKHWPELAEYEADQAP